MKRKKIRSVIYRRVCAASCLLVSLGGALVATWITILSFLLSYTPCLSPRDCLTCGITLSSPPANLLGLPISLWAAAHYLTTATLAGRILVASRGSDASSTHILRLFAYIGAVVSLALASYSAYTLPQSCSLCISLYLYSLLLVAFAWTSRHIAEHPSQNLRKFLRAHPVDIANRTFVALITFICGVGFQSLAYHGMRHFVDADAGCSTREEPLPYTAIRFGASNPTAILAVFLDASSSQSRKVFRELTSAVHSLHFSVPVQLWIYHIPQQVCDPDAFPTGFYMTNDHTRDSDACLAARAVECMENMREGEGFWLLGNLFGLQDQPDNGSPMFTRMKIGDQAADRGLDIDPEDPSNVLYRCINADSSVFETVTAHQRFAEQYAFRIPTVAIYHATAGTPDLTRRPWLANADTPLSVLIYYTTQQASGEADPHP